jgi:hypothetical protein
MGSIVSARVSAGAAWVGDGLWKPNGPAKPGASVIPGADLKGGQSRAAHNTPPDACAINTRLIFGPDQATLFKFHGPEEEQRCDCGRLITRTKLEPGKLQALFAFLAPSYNKPRPAGVTQLLPRVSWHADHQRLDSVLQKVGPKVLDQVRNHTFHFPSPRTNYNPSSDEQLRNVLAGMSDRPCEMHLDCRGEHPVVTLRFAGDVALALALAKHSANEIVARQQFEITSDGAVAFKHWADALVVTYLEATGGYVGELRVIDERSAPATGDDE